MSPNLPKKSPPGKSSGSPAVPSATTSVLGDPLQVGMMIVGVTALFGAAGWGLDKLFHSFPIFFFLGAVLGLFGIIYSFVLRLRESDRNKTDPGQNSPD